jgi:hypothetical protein
VDQILKRMLKRGRGDREIDGKRKERDIST